MIDKEMFPEEHAAIERLKLNSKRIEMMREIRRAEEIRKVEECRRLLDGEEETR